MNIREAQKSNNIKIQAAVTASILILGIVIGLFSKYLDYQQGELPGLLALIDSTLDLHNFLGELGPWILIAVVISVYSHTPVRASVNVFFFFLGFVASYYVYSYYVAGFFPRGYALIWVAFTVVSPFLAYLSWYSKGNGYVALILSGGILGVLMSTTLSYGVFYIEIRSWIHLLMLLIGIIVLRRSVKETIAMLGIAVAVAIVIKAVVPYSIG